jgi:hypothetical protein
MEYIVKNIVEVRFKPDPQIIDIKGEVINSILNNSTLFNNWNITGNTIALGSTKNNSLKIILNHAKWGLEIISSSDDEDFINITTEVIRSTWNHYKYDNIMRLGVRSSFILKCDNSFESLLKQITSKVSILDTEKISSSLTDVAYTYNFAEDNKKINISFGPMQKTQSIDNFPETEKIPEVGIYIDIDVFMDTFEKKFKQSEYITTIKDSVNIAKEKMKIIFDLLEFKNES